jgi:HK97 family phage major capsid protein
MSRRSDPLDLVLARAAEVSERAIFADERGYELVSALCVDELCALLAIAAPTDPTFERVTFTARTLVGFIKLSRELVEDAANAEDVVRSAFAKALAVKLDLAALYGSGIAPEPNGVKNQSGIQTLSMGTNGLAPADFGPLVDQAQKLWEQNFDSPTGYIMAPRTRGELGKLKDTTNQPMRVPDEIANIPRYKRVRSRST